MSSPWAEDQTSEAIQALKLPSFRPIHAMSKTLNNYRRRLPPSFEREWEDGICGRDGPARRFPPPDCERAGCDLASRDGREGNGGRDCDWDLNFPDFCCGGRAEPLD
jgi:hypothetical protein